MTTIVGKTKGTPNKTNLIKADDLLFELGINPIEIIALFPTECINSVQCGIEVLASSNTFGDGESLRITFDSKLGLVLVNGTTMHNNAVRAAPIPTPLVTNDNENDTDASFKLHAIVDHSMVELIINGDVITNLHIDSLIKSHNLTQNDATISAAKYSHPIPFGVLKYNNDGEFVGLDEKPDINQYVSAGIYLLSSNSIFVFKPL